jgi:ABC-2 type transport system permease protein
MKAWAAKYKTAYVVRLKVLSEYKVPLLSYLIRPIFKILLLATIWWQVFEYTNKDTIAGMNVYLFITYLTVAGFIKIAIHPWTITEQVLDFIKTGDLSLILTKPVDYLKFQFALILPEISVHGIYGMVVFLSGSLIASSLFEQFYFPDIIPLILFLISFTLAILISYLFYFIVGCSAFWVGETWSIMGGITTIQAFFSGEIIPLSISPTLMQISNFMPFKFMVFAPIFIFLGKFTLKESLYNIGGQIIWVVILYIIARIVLNKGILKFEAQGG